MKLQVTAFKKHQMVWATVDEIINPEEIIANFSGDLLRVVNQTGQILRAGQRIQLRVEEVHPLRLSLVSSQKSGKDSLGHIDFNV